MHRFTRVPIMRFRNTPLRVFRFPARLLSLFAGYRAARRRRHRRRLEALGRAPAEAGRATQAVTQEGRARLAALGDDLVQLRL